LNKIQLIGRLTRDPEMRVTSTSGKSVANFTLAVDHNFKGANGERGVDFIDCVAWGKGGEIIAQYVQKGHRLGVSGRLQIRQYEAQDGGKRRAAEVVVEDFDFLEPRKDGQPVAVGAGAEAEAELPEDLPF
jgi:single-strand DNA-binding protein